MFWITVILGLAMAMAPWALGYDGNSAATWSSVILGMVMAFVSGYKAAVRDHASWEYWVVVIAGLLSILAPFVMRFSAELAPTWTVVLLGGIAALVALYQVYREDQGSSLV